MINKVLNIIDLDGNGYMDYEEFTIFFNQYSSKDKNVEMRRIFDIIDIKHDGIID